MFASDRSRQIVPLFLRKRIDTQRTGLFEGEETFLVRVTCPVCDRVQKPVRVNREVPPGDLKEGREPTVNPTLL